MKIFENLALTYRQNFKNFLKNVQTAAGIGPKSQNLFGWTIRPPKNPNLFGQGHQASKTANFLWTDHLASRTAHITPRTTIRQPTECTKSRLSYSASILSALFALPDFPWPFLHAPTTALMAFRMS